jgi:hypothetical protein
MGQINATNAVFQGGSVIKVNWWVFAIQKLEALGLLGILDACNIQLVKVVSQLPGACLPGEAMCPYQAERAIYVLDQLFMPPSEFPACLVHECFHMWQEDHADPTTGQGIPIDPVKRELPAYTLNWLFHLLDGDPVTVFRTPPDEFVFYPMAQDLQ